MSKLTSQRLSRRAAPSAPSASPSETEAAVYSSLEHSSAEQDEFTVDSEPADASLEMPESFVPSVEPVEENQAASLVESSSASSLSPPQSIEVDMEPSDVAYEEHSVADEPDEEPSETLIFLDPKSLDLSQDSSTEHTPEMSPTSKEPMAAGAETSAIEAPNIAQVPTPVVVVSATHHATDSNDSQVSLPEKTIVTMIVEPNSDIPSAGLSETSSATAETNSGPNALDTADADSNTSTPSRSAESPNSNSKRRAERNLSDIIGTKSPLTADANRRKIKPSASTSSPSNRHSIAIESPAAMRLAMSASGEITPSGSPGWNGPKGRPASGQPEFGDYSSLSQSPTGKLQSSSSQGGSTSLATSTPIRHSKSNFFSGLLSNGKSHKKDKEGKDKDKEHKDKKDKKEAKEAKQKDKKSKHASVDFQALSQPKGKIVPITPYTMEQIMHSTNVAKPDTSMTESLLVRPFQPIAPFDPSILDSLPLSPIITYPHAHRRSPSPSAAPVPGPVANLQKDYQEPQSAPSSTKKKKKSQRGSEKVSPVPEPAGRSRSNSEATRPPLPTLDKSKSKSKSNKNVFTGGGSQEEKA